MHRILSRLVVSLRPIRDPSERRRDGDGRALYIYIGVVISPYITLLWRTAIYVCISFINNFRITKEERREREGEKKIKFQYYVRWRYCARREKERTCDR